MAAITHGAHRHIAHSASLDGADDPDSGRDPGDSSSDDNDANDLVVDTELDDDEDITRSATWQFLSRAFDRWFQSSQYADHSASTSVDLRFDSFYVFLPYTATSGDNKNLRKLRDATELVAYMLQLDKNAWWFIRKTRKPWFASFFPSNYDPESLVPKMTFVLHQRFGPGDDKPTAVQRLQYMLIDCDRGDGATHRQGARSFFKTKRRILDACDVSDKLRSFKIPIAFQLRPEEARDSDQLRAYLRDVIKLIEAIQHKSCSESSSYPFRLEAISLGMYLDHITDAHAELTQLLALGVPVTIRLRHPHTHISLPFAWTDFGWRANVFPVLVNTVGEPLHTLESRHIHSSVELLSAVAFTSSLSALEIEPDDSPSPQAELEHTKWLAYALRRNTSLNSLTIHQFQATHALLDTMERIVESPDPVRLLSDDDEGTSDSPQLVRLKRDAKIVTPESRGPQSFDELNISSDWELPVVQKTAETVRFVVPGHAIGSTAATNVLSIYADETRLVRSDQQPHSLRTLVLDGAYCDHGVLPRFIKLFGRSLVELRWADSLQGGYDEDLAVTLATCPQLTRIYLQGSCMQSLSAPWLPRLRTLSLMHTAVPMAAMTVFFQSLSDASSPLAQSLENFSYYCPSHSLDEQATEAALAMLRVNRHLQSISLGIASQIYDKFESQFQNERDVEIRVQQLPLASKLAFCSVVERWQKQQDTSALGRMDHGCLAHVLRWLACCAYRRVRVIQSL